MGRLLDPAQIRRMQQPSHFATNRRHWRTRASDQPDFSRRRACGQPDRIVSSRVGGPKPASRRRVGSTASGRSSTTGYREDRRESRYWGMSYRDRQGRFRQESTGQRVKNETGKVLCNRLAARCRQNRQRIVQYSSICWKIFQATVCPRNG